MLRSMLKAAIIAASAMAFSVLSTEIGIDQAEFGQAAAILSGISLTGRLFEKYRKIMVGHGLWAIVCWVYNNPLYMGTVAMLGPFIGGSIMTAGSFAICLGVLVWYNRKGEDWLGVGAVDAIKEMGLYYAERLASWRGGSFLGKAAFLIFFLPIRLMLLLVRLVNHKACGDAIAFVLLSVFEDPFITVAYLRHGNYEPLGRKDMAVFTASVIVSNTAWIIWSVAVIETLKKVWNWTVWF